jgi:phosphate transport system substrate-binding protein
MRNFVCAAALSAAVAAAPLHAAEELSWVGCGITKKAFMSDLATAYTGQTGVNINIQGGGATRGIRESAATNSDMGGACRFQIEGERSEAAAFFEPVAWDALVVITHPDNPVGSITLKQVHQLYLGKLQNWSELGGPDAPIELYVRNGKISGVGRTIRRLVFANFDQEFVASQTFKSTGPLEQAVEKNPNAIAITGISSARKRDVKILALDEVRPTYENIRSGAYTLYRPLYLVYNPGSARKAEIEGFVRFAHSREGKEIIRRNEVVPYSDALGLVMKQLEQERRARDMGLYLSSR